MPESVDEPIKEKVDRALSIVRGFRGAVVALSGGVDSSLVAMIAHKALGESAVSATGQSESLPPEELTEAIESAKSIGIRHIVVRTNELENPDYRSNPQNRCYYCKETLYSALRILADERGLEAILDGTQLDDLKDDRPGLAAAREAGVVSPLLLASFSKADVRHAARNFGLSIWDKPAMPCLSSRIAHGESISVEKLTMIGQAEVYIKRLTGVRNLRVRYSNSVARIEVAPEDRRKLFDEQLLDEINRELRRLGFERVTLDLRGYVKKALPKPSDALTLPMATLSS